MSFLTLRRDVSMEEFLSPLPTASVLSSAFVDIQKHINDGAALPDGRIFHFVEKLGERAFSLLKLLDSFGAAILPTLENLALLLSSDRTSRCS